MPVSALILKNANVITVDTSQPAAGLVAVKGDKIVLVGRNEDLETVKGAKTRVIDCQGKALVPGFNDAHCHIFSFIRKVLSVDLSPAAVKSIAAIKEAIREKAAATPPGQWITGTDYHDFYLAEKRHPTRWEIDEVAPHHPVVLSHRSLHACVLNSQAMALAGINRETSEPPGGVIERDLSTGEPSGLLFEMLGYIRHKVMPAFSEAELAQGTALVNQHFLSVGLTSLQDATITNEYLRWPIYQRFKEKGQLKSRVYLMTGVDELSKFQEAGLGFRSGDDHLRLGGIKIVLTESTGALYPPQPELNRIVLDMHRAGFQVAMHAVQPSTVEAAITALEYVRSNSPQTDRRHRIEHCSECPPALLERLKKVGAVVVSQPPFIYYSGERYLAMIKPEQIQWLYRFKSFWENDLVVAGSSDSPIVPNNPLMGIYAAVTRRVQSGQQLPSQECISARQALAMYTANAAYASFDENIKGTITPGKLADLVLLSGDPTTVPPEEIKDIKVEMTILGGKVVYEA
ncbi:MAG: amidohydrolase [Chloroflexota bacterium]